MAGAMNLLGKKYGLPQAFSLHSSFEWMPEFDKGAVIIAIGESNWLEQHWGEYFKYVEEIGIVEMQVKKANIIIASFYVKD